MVVVVADVALGAAVADVVEMVVVDPTLVGEGPLGNSCSSFQGMVVAVLHCMGRVVFDCRVAEAQALENF